MTSTTTTTATTPNQPPMPPSRQPLLHDALVVLRAPMQAWSAADGVMSAGGIHGIFLGDVRVVDGLRITVGGHPAEHIATSTPSADHTRIHGLLRHLDTESPDPGVVLQLDRTVTSSSLTDTITVHNRTADPIETIVDVEVDLDATAMETVKTGAAAGARPEASIRVADGEATGAGASGVSATWSAESVTATASSTGFTMQQRDDGLRLLAPITVPAGGAVALAWRLDLVDTIAVVRGDDRPVPWSMPTIVADDHRIARWSRQALADLDALRLTTVEHPEHTFLAAGAPWFFTLFGRDSIWAARFMLPLGTALAADTLRVLADMQGTVESPDTAEEPGKVMHELRRAALDIGDGVVLPPLYYGTVDATALWVCLLHDAWRWGMPDDEVRALLPNLQAALAWMRDSGDADGDGLLEYVDKSGHGLANQGWKDSGDSVQWRDGALADGPIALCEVQAYAFEAAVHGADLLDHFGAPGADEWRAWAARLKSAFHERFWITDPEITGPLGAYPAIALDVHKRPVDTVTSNLGHLLGTGLLDADQAALVAARLVSPQLDSGYGLRTMSTDADGYWPLSYHGGSVWTHDTAIAVLGLARDGFGAEAARLADGLLRAAEGFGYRMPELHGGYAVDEASSPVPYPAACRPQAWSAAAAIAITTAALGLEPDADAGTVRSAPIAAFGHVGVSGLRVGTRVVATGGA